MIRKLKVNLNHSPSPDVIFVVLIHIFYCPSEPLDVMIQSLFWYYPDTAWGFIRLHHEVLKAIAICPLLSAWLYPASVISPSRNTIITMGPDALGYPLSESQSKRRRPKRIDRAHRTCGAQLRRITRAFHRTASVCDVNVTGIEYSAE